MHSYIAIHQFTPISQYQSIEALLPFIEESISDQNAKAVVGADGLGALRQNIVKCMEVYYKLVGITDEVIASQGKIEPNGILPRYTAALIGYFQNLQRNDPDNKEIKTLEYAGVTTIKIRYKYTDSVIKKLVKLGLKDPDIFKAPLKIFLKGGALHDLIGMLFICASPYEKIWVARAMYNFFEYDYRTDDHLAYGFYTVERESGYRGLHCDHTLFDPRFDAAFAGENAAPLSEEDAIFSLVCDEDDDIAVLNKLKKYFNIEIQLHTAFENLWATMEHRNSYNIQAKGAGRSREITAQWKLLSDNMQNLEMQFERLQIETEQARFRVPNREGYAFIKHTFEAFEADEGIAYETYRLSVHKIEKLEALFLAREISRQDYAEQIFAEAKQIKAFSETVSDPNIRALFKLLDAVILYGLANHRKFFNSYDLEQFVEKALHAYTHTIDYIVSSAEISKSAPMYIVSILRYLQLAQKYGYGLIDLKDVTFTYNNTPAVSYEIALKYYEEGLSALNQISEEDLFLIKYDPSAYLKIIHRFEILSQEWELFKSEAGTERGEKIAEEIMKFRERFITASLLEDFEKLLETDKITNVGFLVRFYSFMVYHQLCEPLDALKQIVKYSAYDKIKTSDILFYELAAYKFLVIDRCDSSVDCEREISLRQHASEKVRHYGHYHKNNMIQQLFRIYRDESIYDFHKARIHFERLTGTTFKINHFSDTISQI